MSEASWLLVAMISILIAFQVAIALGAPLGKYAYGGQNIGRLPNKLRITSVISVLILLAMQGHVLAQVGIFTPLLPADQGKIANYAIVAFFAIGTLVNLVSRSKAERNIWTPFGLVATMLSVSILL